MNSQDAIELIKAIQKGEFEDARLEVKRAQKGLPTHLYETISAFANQSEGGVIVLGVDEAHQFNLTGVENVQVVLTELTDLASKMEPPIIFRYPGDRCRQKIDHHCRSVRMRPSIQTLLL